MSFMADLEPLNKVLELNVLTQDDQQMLHSVKKHYFENSLISKQLTNNIEVINRNMQNIQILCQGDDIYEQELVNQLDDAKAVLQSIKDRLAPYDFLVNKLNDTRKEAERLSNKLQNEEAMLHKIQETADRYQEELDKQQAELDRLNENINFKISVHKHLKKNLVAKQQMIKRLQLTMEDLNNKMNSDGQDLKLEQQKKQQHIDKLNTTVSKLKQQLHDTKNKLVSEREKADTLIAEWREKTRQATQRKNDIYETFQKGEMETRLLQGQFQRHSEKYKAISKKETETRDELESTIKEIEETRQKIDEYSSVPESHLNTVKQLQAENAQLRAEIGQLTKDEQEARDQASKLRAEYNELESMDIDSRRKKMERQQKSLRGTLERIDIAVSAAESSYTCFECLKPIKGPMTFVPCGHSVCKHHGKHTDDMLICPECKVQCDTVFLNPTIPDLLSKLQFLHSLISTAIEN